MTVRNAGFAWFVVMSLFGLAAPAARPDATGAEDRASRSEPPRCVEIVRTGSRIPTLVCGDDLPVHPSVYVPDAMVDPLDWGSRLSRHFPGLTVNSGLTGSPGTRR